MKLMRTLTHMLRARSVAPLVALSILIMGGSVHTTATTCAAQVTPTMASIMLCNQWTDAALTPSQHELMERALAAASAMPVDPHIKDRSRAQEAVVATYLRLKQPQRALAAIQTIDNWRRGAAYADFAGYLAEHHPRVDITHYLDQASAIADSVEDWRRDLIRVKIGKVYAWHGQSDKAAASEAGVVDAEAGKLHAVAARRMDVDQFDALMTALAAIVATKNFDQIRNVADAYVELFAGSYADDSRRTTVERAFRAAWPTMPAALRVYWTVQLVDAALAHDDLAKAVELLHEAELILGEGRWPAESAVPTLGVLAERWAQAGEREHANTLIAAARARFEAEEATIINIDRASALRPVAEALHTMGDTEACLALYASVLEVGVVNPNSRPRAEDLVATCCSMALHGVTPDEPIANRIRQIQQGLASPW
ncbi:MAG: hypothetical protein SGJ11_09430 [Phycisphaerae bacterium]|nr:hypothetical protein [Phycisphaerae bacterium]